MLDSSLIQPSTSPFSLHVLLVKKKDGSWRFCADYRKLNSVTIKKKFPFHIIGDLLDALHKAKVFYKIDLKAEYH